MVEQSGFAGKMNPDAQNYMFQSQPSPGGPGAEGRMNNPGKTSAGEIDATI